MGLGHWCAIGLQDDGRCLADPHTSQATTANLDGLGERNFPTAVAFGECGFCRF